VKQTSRRWKRNPRPRRRKSSRRKERSRQEEEEEEVEEEEEEEEGTTMKTKIQMRRMMRIIPCLHCARTGGRPAYHGHPPEERQEEEHLEEDRLEEDRLEEVHREEVGHLEEDGRRACSPVQECATRVSHR
jgi:hypothetical protein